MTNYAFIYHGGGKMPESPEEGAKLREKWNAWIESLGDAMVNPETPLGKSKIVSSDGIKDGDGTNPLLGFSIVKADNIDAALETAKGCPYLEIGTIEVAEVMKM